MRITRTVKRKANTNQVKPVKKRPARRYIDVSKQVQYTELLDNSVNNPKTFTYMDPNRNQNAIGLLKKHYEDIIRLYGMDLIYFRKFNKFFQDEEKNTANMIYGEDTTATFYVSGLVRGFLNIENYNWQFNMMRIIGNGTNNY